jgi:hypothetical protein
MSRREVARRLKGRLNFLHGSVRVDIECSDHKYVVRLECSFFSLWFVLWLVAEASVCICHNGTYQVFSPNVLALAL